MFRILAAALLGLMIAGAGAPTESTIAYPKTAIDDRIENRFGLTVHDPYRWLEQDVRDSPAVRAWVDAENQTTERYISTLPRRAEIRQRLTRLWDFEKFGMPHKEGGRYFFQRNSGLQNQYALYVQDGPSAPMRLLLDPNDWSKDGATALREWSASRDGRHLAYAIEDGGTDWRTVKVLDVGTARVEADELRWVKFSSLVWNRDGTGFYYARYPQPEKGAEFQSANRNQSINFHRLGTDQAEDVRVFATPDQPELTHNVDATHDGNYLLIYSRQGTDDRCEVHLIDLRETALKPRTIVPGFKDAFALAGSEGDTLYFVTDRDAPRYRVVALNVSGPAMPEATEIVPEARGTLREAAILGHRIVANYIDDAKSAVRVFGLDGKTLGEVQLPGIGSVSGFDGTENDPESFYAFSSITTPTTIYRFDAQTLSSTVFKQPAAPFDPADYELSQIFYTSKDGTRVPMFIAHSKSVDLARPNPTLLFGYGGFNIPELPRFDVSRLAWMQMGGIYAVANLRGGGEYGQAWHDAGRLLNKQNGFDDFIAAAEYLVRRKITTPRQLAIFGRSNGGLLVGAVVNQRPDLFAAALPQVGVMDMLRFDRFTVGRLWIDDYGDPADETHYRNLLSYSPYHNIQDGKIYPAILATTGETDDRVVPGHSFKYVAALQAANIGPKPHLIRIESRAGHATGGAGKPTEKLIAEYTDEWTFIGYFTGLTSGGRSADVQIPGPGRN